VLEVAKRYEPGRLMDPEHAGLVAEPICILSGMRATSACPSMIEWFAPGTEPRQPDTWQQDGRVALPAEYAEWAAGSVRTGERASSMRTGERANGRTGDATSSPQIISPLDGDRYEYPPGVDRRYVTIPLVASAENSRVRWSVDEKPLSRARWQAVKGTHVIRANWPGGGSDSVRVVVE